MIISLIIPTRERAQYLAKTLQTATQIDDEKLEIIVSDNASTDGTCGIVQQSCDPRLGYINTGRRVSMRQNFEFALQHSSGDYVIFIGDDDAILPGQFRFLRQILEEQRPDSLSWDRPTYGWPIEGYGNRTGSVKLQRDRVYGSIETVNCAQSRQQLLRCDLGDGGPKPAIYHGCISRDFLNRIAGPNGESFRGSIPDVYVSYQAILNNANALHSPHPFSLNGYSPASTGGGHHGFDSKDPRSRPGHQFGQENEQDPTKDVMGFALSVPLAFFSTLETIRSLSPISIEKPDYRAWYHFVLASVRVSDQETNHKLRSILSEYAERTGTQAELNEASRTPAKVVGKLRKYTTRLEKLRALRYRKRISAEIDGQNNSLTAAITYDHVLGDDYAGILDGTRTVAQCWKAAMRRCREPRSLTSVRRVA